MTSTRIHFTRSLFFLLTALPLWAANYKPATFTAPSPIREFRGAWVATVGNIDWPSRRDLSVADQKAELLAILDRAAQLKLNAIIFQVRPACDALYASQIEPWSEYLTGAMGQSPQPPYDPLAFAIEEAHKRGLELHAWFNPYRARHPNAKSPISANHISKTRPHLVRKYGGYLWLDPGEKEVQDYSLSVVMDVLKRYDVDGIHFDDYFYPYAERGADGKELDFPDAASWKKSGAGGKLSRNDWRRENVNTFVRRVHESIKVSKPWVKFGISPFGIWRPGHPPQIKGFDAYDQLYADARKWLVNGWVDYFVPQLYWAIEPKAQSFPILLDWWNEQNPKKRHIWPGMNTTRVREAWKPEEIVNQISLAKKQPVSAGHVHWNMKSLMRSTELGTTLQRSAYAGQALVPACEWLDSTPPGKPQLNVAAGKTSAKLSWSLSGENAWLWVLHYRRGGVWSTKVLPGAWRSHILDGELPDALALSAVDRVGNVSPAATLTLRKQ
jgi:uncharacterized lipoprotein YddW (UPF0748 family)